MSMSAVTIRLPFPEQFDLPNRAGTVATPDPYLEHHETIERSIEFVCRRHRLTRDDAEDFASAVRLRLLADDAAVLRKFEGRSSINTFLVAVVTHQYQDWRNAQWGKWRPSAEAKRIGPLAILLETRLLRDGLTMDEAVETLRTNHGVVESRDALEEIAARLPVRHQRVFVTTDSLDDRPAEHGNPESHVARQEAGVMAQRASVALETALATLTPEDLVIIRLRFYKDLRISDIAKVLNLDQRGLYRRLEQVCRSLRAALESDGIMGDDAVAALRDRGFDLTEPAPLPDKISTLPIPPTTAIPGERHS